MIGNWEVVSECPEPWPADEAEFVLRLGCCLINGRVRCGSMETGVHPHRVRNAWLSMWSVMN
jgi:hypothetical protein